MDLLSRGRNSLNNDEIGAITKSIRKYFFGNNLIRTVCRDDEIWMVFSDVCRALGYANSRDQFKKLPDEVRTKVDVLAKNTLVGGVNKAGLYRFCTLSDKSQARELYAWAKDKQIFEDYDGR